MTRQINKNPGRGSDVSRRHVGPAADAPSSRVCEYGDPNCRVSFGGQFGTRYHSVNHHPLYDEPCRIPDWLPSDNIPDPEVRRHYQNAIDILTPKPSRTLPWLFIWATLLTCLFGLAFGCSSYTRAEYLNVDGDVYQYAQVINGTRLDLGNGFALDLGMGEHFRLDSTKPREVIRAGGSFKYGRLSIHALTDVIGPWDVNPEVSLYTSMELTY